MKTVGFALLGIASLLLEASSARGVGSSDVFVRQICLPPPTTRSATADIPIIDPVRLPNAPDYAWWYGCAPTAAGMLMAYYDINGYRGFDFDDLVPGSMAELSTFPTQVTCNGYPGASPQPSCWTYLAQDAIASMGHVDDFYRAGYMASGDDIAGTRPFDSLADFMGSSQDASENLNGGTLFLLGIPTPSRLHPADVPPAYRAMSGTYGIAEYVAFAGYAGAPEDVDIYLQFVDARVEGGFSFADYKAEIDAGRPVMLLVEGHAMFGYGYADPQVVLLHDTWFAGGGAMEWNVGYTASGDTLELVGVVVFNPVPEPSSVLYSAAALSTVFLSALRRGPRATTDARGAPDLDAATA